MVNQTAISEPTNGAEVAISTEFPYTVSVTVEGASDILFHAWNCEAVKEKGSSKKGSAAKKTDNLESYVYRDDDGCICLPGEYLRGAIIHAAKFRQDPRSPRKSAMDLYKAGIVTLEPLVKIFTASGKPSKQWDYEHRCRVTIQRAGITRVRPAFKKGWTATAELMVNLPEYIEPSELNSVISAAGRLIGLADFRPTYGRFVVTHFEVQRPVE